MADNTKFVTAQTTLGGIRISASFDIGKEAEAVQYGKTTLSPKEMDAYKNLVKLYDATGQNDKAALQAFKKGLKDLHSFTDGDPNKVAGRFLYHMAHGSPDYGRGGIVDTAAEFPQSTKMLQNGKPADFFDVLKTGMAKGTGSENARINQWPEPEINGLKARSQAAQALGQHAERTGPNPLNMARNDGRDGVGRG